MVQIEYDPAIISTERILTIFFFLHNPTLLNRQNDEDVGTQYRSVIFYHDDEQKSIAKRLIDELEDSETYNDSIVTEVKPIEKFYPAEEYHQDYFNRNPQNTYCQRVVKPKVEKFVKTYNDFLESIKSEVWSDNIKIFNLTHVKLKYMLLLLLVFVLVYFAFSLL